MTRIAMRGERSLVAGSARPACTVGGPRQARVAHLFANGGAGYTTGVVADSLGQTSSCLPLIHCTNTDWTMPVPSGRNFTGPSTVVISVAATAARSFSRSSAPARVSALATIWTHA